MQNKARSDSAFRGQLLEPIAVTSVFGAWSPDQPGRPNVSSNRYKPYRWVQIVLPRDGRTPAQLIQHFSGMGLFDFVDYSRSGCHSMRLEWDQSSVINDPLFNFAPTDPHRHQWPLTAARFQGAFQYTEGRALVAAIDQGLPVSNPEFAGNLRRHYTASANEYFISGFQTVGRLYPQDDLIGPSTLLNLQSVPRVAHGLHVAGTIAARKNAIGVSGACPACSFAFVRAFLAPESTRATEALANIGVSAINYSYSVISADQSQNVSGQIAAALDMFEFADAREVMIVGSMGNDMENVQTIAPRPMPGALSFALGVGASDVRGWRWEELLLATSPVVGLQGRHPLTNYSNEGTFRVTERCAASAPAGTKTECGSNFGTFQAHVPIQMFKTLFPVGRWGIDVVAPGVQVLSTMDRIYTDFACFLPGEAIPPGQMQCSGRVTPGSGPNPLPNEGSYAPQRNNLGNGGAIAFPGAPNGYQNVPNNLPLPSQFAGFGAMTGTSMAAPLVTALVGLVRSIVPLMGNPAVEELIRNASSRSVIRMPTPPGRGPWTEQEVGAGLIDAEAAVVAALGKSAGVQLRNRLTPVIAMVSTDPDWSAEGAGTGAWLYTTSPQVASAAYEGRLYITDDPPSPATISARFNEPLPADPNGWDFGTRISVGYQSAGNNWPSTSIGTNIGVDPTGSGRFIGGIGTRFPPGFIPTASFMLYSTPYDTHANAANALIPLYRLSMKCNKFRKHFYSTSASEVAVYEAGSDQVCTAASGPSSGQGYNLDGIEGYLYASPRGGIYTPYEIALYRGYNPTVKSWALMTAAELARPEYAGYTTAVQQLGYVLKFAEYNSTTVDASPVDQDADALNDAIEVTLLGTSITNQDTDGDSEFDGEEYTLDGARSDPRQ